MHIHKFDMHGIPLPPKPIKQEQQRTQPPGKGRWVKPVDSILMHINFIFVNFPIYLLISQLSKVSLHLLKEAAR